MGGKGSGGSRWRSGPAPQSSAMDRLGGHAGRRGSRRQRRAVIASQTSSVVEVVSVAQPSDLTADESEVWQSLAPHAIVARTLMPGTALAFGLLCRVVVLERELSRKKHSSL